MILLVRHCSAMGQSSEAELTETGKVQSEELVVQISNRFNVTRIISSPFKRAIDTIRPLARHFHLKIECDQLLRERFFHPSEFQDGKNLDSHELDAKLKHSFVDLDYKACEEGESNKECQERAHKFLKTLDDVGVTVVVSHGNFIAMLLGLGYEEMCSLSRPDVILLNYNFESKQLMSFERIHNT